jgi:2'-5' RNA ligase
MSLRLFVALEPPLPVREAVVQIASSPLWPRAARPVSVANIHLTLLFLGERPEAELETYKELLEAACRNHGPLQLTAQSFGGFPNVKRARTLWTGLSGDLEALLELQNSIEHALSEAPSEHRFVPHLTLGRLKEPEPVIKLANAFRETVFGQWTADEVLLFSSELTPKGAIYRVLHRVMLGGSPTSV